MSSEYGHLPMSDGTPCVCFECWAKRTIDDLERENEALLADATRYRARRAMMMAEFPEDFPTVEAFEKRQDEAMAEWKEMRGVK